MVSSQSRYTLRDASFCVCYFIKPYFNVLRSYLYFSIDLISELLNLAKFCDIAPKLAMHNTLVS